MNFTENDYGFAGWDSVETLQEANPPDSILGLGNKKKKAEKKLKKAEKALAQGNTKKAERKIDKAIKKGAQVADKNRGELAAQIKVTQEKVDAENATKAAFKESVQRPPKLVEEIQPMDPITLPDSPDVPGSGLTTPISGGGGGDMGGSYEYETQGGEMVEEQPIEGGELPPVVITNKKTNWLIVAAVVFALVGIFLYLKKRK
jgi:hypothetical protein